MRTAFNYGEMIPVSSKSYNFMPDIWEQGCKPPPLLRDNPLAREMESKFKYKDINEKKETKKFQRGLKKQRQSSKVNFRGPKVSRRAIGLKEKDPEEGSFEEIPPEGIERPDLNNGIVATPALFNNREDEWGPKLNHRRILESEEKALECMVDSSQLKGSSYMALKKAATKVKGKSDLASLVKRRQKNNSRRKDLLREIPENFVEGDGEKNSYNQQWQQEEKEDKMKINNYMFDSQNQKKSNPISSYILDNRTDKEILASIMNNKNEEKVKIPVGIQYDGSKTPKPLGGFVGSGFVVSSSQKIVNEYRNKRVREQKLLAGRAEELKLQRVPKDKIFGLVKGRVVLDDDLGRSAGPKRTWSQMVKKASQLNEVQDWLSKKKIKEMKQQLKEEEEEEKLMNHFQYSKLAGYADNEEDKALYEEFQKSLMDQGNNMEVTIQRDQFEEVEEEEENNNNRDQKESAMVEDDEIEEVEEDEEVKEAKEQDQIPTTTNNVSVGRMISEMSLGMNKVNTKFYPQIGNIGKMIEIQRGKVQTLKEEHQKVLNERRLHKQREMEILKNTHTLPAAKKRIRNNLSRIDAIKNRVDSIDPEKAINSIKIYEEIQQQQERDKKVARVYQELADIKKPKFENKNKSQKIQKFEKKKEIIEKKVKEDNFKFDEISEEQRQQILNNIIEGDTELMPRHDVDHPWIDFDD